MILKVQKYFWFFTFKIVIASACLGNSANICSPYNGTKCGSQTSRHFTMAECSNFLSLLPPSSSLPFPPSVFICLSRNVNTLIISSVWQLKSKALKWDMVWNVSAIYGNKDDNNLGTWNICPLWSERLNLVQASKSGVGIANTADRGSAVAHFAWPSSVPAPLSQIL